MNSPSFKLLENDRLRRCEKIGASVLNDGSGAVGFSPGRVHFH